MNRTDERKIDKNGYVLIYKPNHKYSTPKKGGWILEHRVVFEDFHKRNLARGECIHHKDGDKTNNKIRNLMLFKSHREHSEYEDNSAKQIVEKHRDKVDKIFRKQPQKGKAIFSRRTA
jgi:hypothetical protein